MDINLLLEKYLNTYKDYQIPGVTDVYTLSDVFVNPSRKDIYDARFDYATEMHDDSVRFIADEKKKRVFVWGAYNGLHQDIWNHIKKDISDSRKLYEADDLLMGVYDVKKRKVTFESRRFFTPKAYETIQQKDWSFADKWIPNLSMEWEKISGKNRFTS